MTRITLEDAAKTYPARLADIQRAIEEFDLAVETDANGETSLRKDALERALETRDLVLDPPGLQDRISALTVAVSKAATGKLTLFFTGIAALAAALATGLSVYAVFFRDENVLSATKTYDAISAAYGRLTDASAANQAARTYADAAASESDPEMQKQLILQANLQTAQAIVQAQALDSQIALLKQLRNSEIIDSPAWKDAMQFLCKPLARNEYFDLAETIFSASYKICEEARQKGEWTASSPQTPPDTAPDQDGG